MYKTYKANILIVDDDQVNIHVLSKTLTNEGFKIIISCSGMEALAELHKQTIDVILLDNIMPEITGIELLDIIMCDDRLKEIPVIMLSSNTDTSEIIRALDKGAIEYLKKPIDENELIARIRTTLRIKDHELNLKRIYKTIEQQSILIAESIESAKKIQTALLPTSQTINKLFNNAFIIYKPRDIVSGDFYWFDQKDDRIYIVEADCTGHGISGALLSMIGYSLLNEIILHKKISQPVDILRNLNNDFAYALNKNLSNEDMFLFDGMDLSVAMIDKNSEELTIAAAGQDAYILDHNNNIKKLSGDLFSIGYDIRGELFMNFTEYKMSFEEVKSFFLLSDGFIDQFGGRNFEKYSSRQFEKFLKIHAQTPMSELKILLEKELQTWKGNNIQTDDILIIGIEM